MLKVAVVPSSSYISVETSTTLKLKLPMNIKFLTNVADNSISQKIRGATRIDL